MSLGDHLEELRKRIILALAGFLLVGVVTMVWGQQVVEIFCRPLINVLVQEHINPQLYFTSAGDVFSVYLDISMISAAVLAGPWILWQMWLFVAAGLYPKERKAVWRLAPLSVGLLVVGVLFCYFVALPMALRFFIIFGGDMSLNLPTQIGPAATQPAALLTIPAIDGNPPTLSPYQFWFDTAQQRLKFALPDRNGKLQAMVIHFGTQSLVTPLITLPDYINMVLKWLLIFGLCFQLPLVTLALVRLGLVTVADLSKFRRYVYVGLTIIACILMPDVISGSLGLMVPLCLLYEFGIILARISTKKVATEELAAGASDSNVQE